MARTRQNSKMAKLDPKGARHGPHVKHVVKGGKRQANPKDAANARMSPLRGPKFS